MIVKKDEMIVSTHHIEDWYANGLSGVFIALVDFNIRDMYNAHMATHHDSDGFEQHLIEIGFIMVPEFRQFDIDDHGISEETFVRGWFKNVQNTTENQ